MFKLITMKNILIVLTIAPFWSCKGQTILPLSNSDMDVEGAYYKDVNNDLDNFIGTWKYATGTTSLTITLQKKIMQNFDDGHIQYFEDIIIGGYKYIDNGIEKINTLPQLATTLSDNYSYHIVGNVIAEYDSSYCIGCSSGDKAILLQFSDPDREILGMEPEIIIRRVDEGGIQKVKLIFRTISGPIVRDGQLLLYTSYTIPFGEYLLVKQ